MSDQDAFERVLASLYDAMLDDALWPATSALIDDACGLQGNALFIGEGPQDDVRVTAAGLGTYYRGERRGDLDRTYLEVYHPIDESIPRLRQLPDSRVVHITDLYTAEELKTSRTYNEGGRLATMQDSLRVRLDGPSDSHITWQTTDPVSGDGWGSAQLGMIQALLPHIRQFVRVRQALAEAEALRASVTSLLVNARIGVIHLDWRGRIMEANDRARDLLRQGDGVVGLDGMLSAPRSADQARLDRLVADALPTSGAAVVSGSMPLSRPSGLPPLVVHVKPVDARQRAAGAERVAALVLITEPGHGTPIDPALVSAALGLTKTEGRIAAWVAEGRTVREIAGLTGQTEGTVRWHLHTIYHKHDLAGQVALVRLVLAAVRVA